LAQRRVILFFWPMRASSANQISIVSRSVELGRLSCRLAIQETVRTAGVEAQHPVPDDLKINAQIAVPAFF
jgi:hypothetical protein